MKKKFDPKQKVKNLIFAGTLEKELERWLRRKEDVTLSEIKLREWLKKQMAKLGLKTDKKGPLK